MKDSNCDVPANKSGNPGSGKPLSDAASRVHPIQEPRNKFSKRSALKQPSSQAPNGGACRIPWLVMGQRSSPTSPPTSSLIKFILRPFLSICTLIFLSTIQLIWSRQQHGLNDGNPQYFQHADNRSSLLSSSSRNSFLSGQRMECTSIIGCICRIVRDHILWYHEHCE